MQINGKSGPVNAVSQCDRRCVCQLTERGCVSRTGKAENMSVTDSSRVSSLSRTVTRDGYSVSIDIHEDDEGGWLLQLVDLCGNLTGWNKSFETDRAALDEAMRAIEEEGITSFIGSVSDNFPWHAK